MEKDKTFMNSKYLREDSQNKNTASRNKNISASKHVPNRTVKTSFNDFRLSRSTYANLIDQSDIKWFADIQSQRLAGGAENKKFSENTEFNVTERNLPFEPILCPCFECDIYFLPSDMIMHFLHFHQGPAFLERLLGKQHLNVAMKPFELSMGEIQCVGLISFGPKLIENSMKEICIKQNLLLHEEYQRLSGDYPVFVLACVVPMDIFIQKNVNLIQVGKGKMLPKMLILWLAGLNSKQNIYCTIVAYNEERTYSRSALVDVRLLSNTQNPHEFCNLDCGYFPLSFKELSILAVGSEKHLNVDLVFHENFDL